MAAVGNKLEVSYQVCLVKKLINNLVTQFCNQGVIWGTKGAEFERIWRA